MNKPYSVIIVSESSNPKTKAVTANDRGRNPLWKGHNRGGDKLQRGKGVGSSAING